MSEEYIVKNNSTKNAKPTVVQKKVFPSFGKSICQIPILRATDPRLWFNCSQSWSGSESFLPQLSLYLAKCLEYENWFQFTFGRLNVAYVLRYSFT